MARIRRAKSSIPTDDNLMLPFEWNEADADARAIVPVPRPRPRRVVKPETKPVHVPVPFRQPVPPPPMPSTPFGTWLLAQTRNDGWIGDLAKAAKADGAFPRGGDADAVRRRLSLAGAEADMVEAVDAAELAWLAC